MADWWKLRDELAAELRGVPGVISIGVGKSDHDVVLVILVDRNHFRGIAPSLYKGVRVVVRDFGTGIAHRLLEDARDTQGFIR
jgi:hypothetical protein